MQALLWLGQDLNVLRVCTWSCSRSRIESTLVVCLALLGRHLLTAVSSMIRRGCVLLLRGLLLLREAQVVAIAVIGWIRARLRVSLLTAA